MRRRRAAGLLGTCVACLGAAGGATADERPLTIPSRDVDVLYRIVQADAPGGPRALEQRMRWSAGTAKLRVDPPTPGLYMIVDYGHHRLQTVRDAERMVIELDGGSVGMAQPGGVAPGGQFARRGQEQVAGAACTDWQTRDAAGQPAVVCLTADGVLLRASGAGRVLLEAERVTYGPIDPAAFQVPADYRRVLPPADPAAPPRAGR